MTARTASRLAWSLWGAALALLVANVVLSVRADTLGDTGVFVFVYPIFLLAFATVMDLPRGQAVPVGPGLNDPARHHG